MGDFHWLWSGLDQMLKAVKLFWPSDISSVKLLARSELDAAQAVLFCHRQFVFLFLGSSFNKHNLFSYGSGAVLNLPDKCSQVFKIFGIKDIRPDVFCCLHHSRLCTPCWNDYCHHPVKGSWWKTLSPSDELSIRPCPVQSAQVLFLNDILPYQSGLFAA